MSVAYALGPQPELRIQSVSKSYRIENEPLPVLKNISFDIGAGEFVSVVGASGCGKSTLLRLIIGLDTDYDGDILLGSRRIEGPGPERGIVFQEHRLFPWLTVRQNIALGLEALDPAEANERIVENIALVGLSGFETAYPYQLSGGMAQRAAIARALVTRPEILLLDEPLGALDSLTRTYLQNELLRIWQQERITMIMVTHDIEEAVYLSDKIVVMEPRPGRVRSVVPVALDRPRHRASTAFAAIKEEIFATLS
jgi:ABC-type nitrate/sulfonate/bicarbonate transport system ATPase subunit